LTKQGESSGWWILLPLVFSFLGGILAFLILRKEDYWSAKFYLFAGFIVTIAETIAFVIWVNSAVNIILDGVL